ncbi:hypothetical protein D3C86_1597670 [compost metagenome]
MNSAVRADIEAPGSAFWYSVAAARDRTASSGKLYTHRFVASHSTLAALATSMPVRHSASPSHCQPRVRCPGTLPANTTIVSGNRLAISEAVPGATPS